MSDSVCNGEVSFYPGQETVPAIFERGVLSVEYVLELSLGKYIDPAVSSRHSDCGLRIESIRNERLASRHAIHPPFSDGPGVLKSVFCR